MGNSLKIRYRIVPTKTKSMNLISKLVTFSILIIFGCIIFLCLKINDLTENHILLGTKLESIKSDFDNKIEGVKSEFNDKYSSINKQPTENTELTKDIFYGIDVSHWNGDVITEISNESDISFVIVKATQGKSYIDPEFKYNWQSLKKINKIRGAYHFYMFNDDPTSQAKHFCDIVSDLDNSDLSLILDVEEMSLPKGSIDHSKFKNDLLTFLIYIEQRTNRTPILYTDYSFANQYLDDARFEKYHLWLAEYTKADTPKIPVVWKDKGCFIWQKTNRFSIHSTKADYDVFYGKLEELLK
jgi:lysozyme